MSEESKESKKCRGGAGGAQFSGMFWFAGWLFTIAFAKLVWWQILLGIIIWPYFLGAAVVK